MILLRQPICRRRIKNREREVEEKKKREEIYSVLQLVEEGERRGREKKNGACYWLEVRVSEIKMMNIYGAENNVIF